MPIKPIAVVAVCTVLAAALSGRAPAGDEEKVRLTISGGHQTDPRDHGRPVTLIAAALGVPADVFREAFTQVTPAPRGTEPDPAQVRRNKSALMAALAPLGVTNELLDRVSNYYRYIPEDGRLWPTSPAAAYATIKDGDVTAIVVTEPGSGYSSAPAVSIPGHPAVALQATLAFGRDLEKNGSVSTIAKADAGNRGK
jgi:hypothetical protein